MTSINQKEYLKKYLGIGKAPGEKKKKKKKEKSYGNRLKIVDDDIEATISQEIQDDLSAANEDAPLVVAVIDERPPSLRIDDETKDNLWKPIGEPDTIIEDVHNFKLGSGFKLTRSNKNSPNAQTEFKKPGNIQNFNASRSRTKEKYNHSSHDMSPPRKRESVKSEKYNDSSPLNQRSRFQTESYNDSRQHKDIDFSPPRRNRDPVKSTKEYEDRGVKKERNIDFSPPRRNKEGMKSNKNNADNFPKPRNREGGISILRNNIDTTLEKDDDNSPPRKRIRECDVDPSRKNKSHHKYGDNSPPRQRNKDQDRSSRKKRDNDISPPRKTVRGKSNSPSRKHSTSEERYKKSRWGSPERSNDILEKMKTTLSGKRAGLQNAKDITHEIISLREKEDDMFRNMSEEVSGINAVTVVRDRVPRDLEEETHQLKKQKETQEKYDRWGKGLKQVQDQSEKMAEQLYEMSKPLARYADDEDLDKYLKEQEREGDPMLAYIRKKKKKKAVEAGIPEKPTYMGEFMPNRFGIRPGYRWDGVDRSNGYEKKWFEVQNKKKANIEEAHKWSTEDM